MAYIFKLEHWASVQCANRLSTRQGLYADAPYNLTVNKLMEHFYRHCPFAVAWDLRKAQTKFYLDCVHDTHIPYSWMEQNLQGFWREIGFAEKVKSPRYRKLYKNHSNVVRFQRKQDAILFKLTWAGNES